MKSEGKKMITVNFSLEFKQVKHGIHPISGDLITLQLGLILTENSPFSSTRKRLFVTTIVTITLHNRQPQSLTW